MNAFSIVDKLKQPKSTIQPPIRALAANYISFIRNIVRIITSTFHRKNKEREREKINQLKIDWISKCFGKLLESDLNHKFISESVVQSIFNLHFGLQLLSSASFSKIPMQIEVAFLKPNTNFFMFFSFHNSNQKCILQFVHSQWWHGCL